MEPILPPTDPPPLNPPEAPQETPKMPEQLEQYYRYHNRLASFHDWPLEWEVDGAKPSPEVLARAGFFSHHEPPQDRDNVVCPYCKLFLDTWEPGDDPVAEHRLRSPHCEFLRGPGCVRRRRRLDTGGSVTQTTDAPKEENGEMTMLEANGTGAGANLGEVNQVDTAVSDSTGGPSKESTRGDARGGSRGGARGSIVGRVRGTGSRGPGRPRGIGAWQRGGRGDKRV